MAPLTLAALLTTCAPQVHPSTAAALVAVESGGNPYAIGVVRGSLVRQPTNRREAVATARALQAAGWNFSVGLGQINVHNFDRLGLTFDSAFDGCANLRAMEVVLEECFEHATAATSTGSVRLRHALSCYYSGNFRTGYEHGYVRKVVATASTTSIPIHQREAS